MLVGVLALLCSGCVQKEFQPEKAQGIIGYAPIHLDAEQVMLSPTQVDCGVQQDLWDPAAPLGERSLARLTEKGRALKFDDDVVVTENGYRSPYVQVRGDFPMVLADGPAIREDGPYGRYVNGKLHVIIQHACFPQPLPVMGVKHGRFSQDVLPTMHFKLDVDGWRFDGLIH
jgi:hypothetical protein